MYIYYTYMSIFYIYIYIHSVHLCWLRDTKHCSYYPSPNA